MLNTKQQQVIDLVQEGRNVFVSGSGGTGKSYVIDHIRMNTRQCIVTGPTGLSAINISGATLHSTFQAPLHIALPGTCNKKPGWKAMDIFRRGNPILIIDEISMVRADLLTFVDVQLKRIRDNLEPFGGLQVVVLGDFYQLPPVLTGEEEEVFYQHYDSVYPFDCDAWKQANFATVILDEVVRQNDQEMVKHLEQIRIKGDKYLESVEYFNTAGTIIDNVKKLKKVPTILCTTVEGSERHNRREYRKIKKEERVYTASITGKFYDEPAPKVLALKEGVKVLFTSNSENYTNGESGVILSMAADSVKVEMDGGYVIDVKPHVWQSFEYERSPATGQVEAVVSGTYSQLPFKMGWAVTIHKSQGQTLDNVAIDFGRGCFATGQAYVALSRVKSVKGLFFIDKFFEEDILVSNEVKSFYQSI